MSDQKTPEQLAEEEAAKKEAADLLAKKEADKKSKAKAEAKADAAAKPVAVKFLKGHSFYNKGETAGFSKEKADWLIEKKVAVKAK